MTAEENKITDQDREEAEALALEEGLAGVRGLPFMVMVKVADLHVDPLIQRRLSPDRVNGLAQKYNADAVGVLTASRRDDGKYYLLDGQHRQAALLLLNKGQEEVQVKAFQGLSRGEEGVLFRLLNNTKRPQPVDLFKVKLIEQDPLAIQMFKLLTKYDWKLRSGVKDGSFMAIKTLEKLFAIDADLAETAVNILCGAWGNRTGTLNDGLLGGMGKLLLHRGDEIDGSRMIKMLEAVPKGPREVINKAATMREALSMTVPGSVAYVLIDIYNKDLRSRKLEPWTGK